MLGDEFDDGWYLRAQLTIPCDDSPRRKLFLGYAWAFVVVYPIGGSNCTIIFSPGSQMTCVFPCDAACPCVFGVIMFRHRSETKQIIEGFKKHDSQHKGFTTTMELAHIANHSATDTAAESPPAVRVKKHRPSLITKAADFAWLASKFDKFQGHCWWTSTFLISMRLLQTSAMLLLESSSVQAVVASLLAQVGVCVQRNVHPYRRQSDNDAALYTQWCVAAATCWPCALLLTLALRSAAPSRLIFLWCFVLLVRHSGALNNDNVPPAAIGALLITGTLATLGQVIRSLFQDMRKDTAVRRQTKLLARTETEHGEQSGAAGSSMDAEDEAKGEVILGLETDDATATISSTGSMWKVAILDTLCGADADAEPERPLSTDQLKEMIAERDAQISKKDATIKRLLEAVGPSVAAKIEAEIEVEVS